MGVHARFALANRRQIEAEIERLIALLDLADGDCDLEDDDPAGGNVEDEGDRGDGEEYCTPIFATHRLRVRSA